MDQNKIKKEYTNGEVTIVWQPGLCIHSTFCWKGEAGLHAVFNPKERPWIKPEGASTARIVEQVKKCPSGALSYFMNKESISLDQQKVSAARTGELSYNSNLVELSPNGPLLVHGEIIIKDKEGNEIPRSNVTAFCRCGASASKPFCDGSHRKIGFSDE